MKDSKVKPMKLPPRSAEEEARLAQYRGKLGQSLVDNLNRNLRKAPAKPAEK